MTEKQLVESICNDVIRSNGKCKRPHLVGFNIFQQVCVHGNINEISHLNDDKEHKRSAQLSASTNTRHPGPYFTAQVSHHCLAIGFKIDKNCIEACKIGVNKSTRPDVPKNTANTRATTVRQKLVIC